MGPAGLILTSWEAEGEREAWAQEPEASAPRDQGPEGQRQGSIAGNVMLGDSNPKGLSSSGQEISLPFHSTERKQRLLLAEEMGTFISTNIS